jgi:hypothetical protein
MNEVASMQNVDMLFIYKALSVECNDKIWENWYGTIIELNVHILNIFKNYCEVMSAIMTGIDCCVKAHNMGHEDNCLT